MQSHTQLHSKLGASLGYSLVSKQPTNQTSKQTKTIRTNEKIKHTSMPRKITIKPLFFLVHNET